MSTQHTPGPWVAIDGRILPERYVLTGASIATVHARKVAGMQAGNAHLMAAAPDMHEALKSIREYLSRCPPHSEDRTGAEWGRMMDLSGAALARAEGKS